MTTSPPIMLLCGSRTKIWEVLHEVEVTRGWLVIYNNSDDIRPTIGASRVWSVLRPGQGSDDGRNGDGVPVAESACLRHVRREGRPRQRRELGSRNPRSGRLREPGPLDEVDAQAGSQDHDWRFPLQAWQPARPAGQNRDGGRRQGDHR